MGGAQPPPARGSKRSESARPERNKPGSRTWLRGAGPARRPLLLMPMRVAEQVHSSLNNIDEILFRALRFQCEAAR